MGSNEVQQVKVKRVAGTNIMIDPIDEYVDDVREFMHMLFREPRGYRPRPRPKRSAYKPYTNDSDFKTNDTNGNGFNGKA